MASSTLRKVRRGVRTCANSISCVDDVAFDAFVLERSVNPKPVETGFSDPR
jgi:hypothetical protein